MTEQDREKRLIKGDTTVTSHSDEAISADLDAIMKGIPGLPNQDIIIEGETLKPHKMISTEELNPDVQGQTAIISKLDHTSSRLGLITRGERLKKLKKAA